MKANRDIKINVGINFNKIEKKWQKRWEKERVFEAREDAKKKKYYVLEMYPYSSASGLHIGHAFNYIIGDIIARFMKMNGFNVLHPMGYDSFGLPAENAAVKNNSHPKIYTEKAIENFIKQQKALGLSYDWTRKIQSHDINYYKWNQYLFLQLMKKGLVYRKKSPVNWCPKCSSVLANEQVHEGKCWVHKDTEIEITHLEQWFIKTTQYAEELLEKVEALDWPDRIKAMQKNWIGKSQGIEIDFKINGQNWSIFTTRPDTIYGVTFMVVSTQHPRLMELVTEKQKKEVGAFLKKVKSTSEKDLTELEKEGAFTGAYAEHPFTGEKVPVWAGNFVVADYGSGMVMAVPAHDQRDFEFAKKYGIPIKTVIRQHTDSRIFFISRSLKNDWKEKLKESGYLWSLINNADIEIILSDNKVQSFISIGQEILKEGPYYFSIRGNSKQIIFKNKIFDVYANGSDELAKEYGRSLNIPEKELAWSTAYTDEGILINSDKFNGTINREAIEEISNYLEKKKIGKRVVNYKLRDWLVSRQRYWGTPIPVIYCDKCGAVPVPEKELPIRLPEDIKFGQGNPLATSRSFSETKCPKCKGKAKRETDTMDTFFDSSWYYLRFCDATNTKEPFDKKKIEYWMPVDFYTGGAEHACMHLIYARFFTKALRDLGFLKFDEPFTKLFNQGMVHGEDGVVMSKSRGNVVDPLEIIKKYSADALRLFLVSMASPDKDSSWSVNGFEGSWKFVNKVYNFGLNTRFAKSSGKLEHKINKNIKEITEDIENLKYNITVIKLREIFEEFEEGVSKEDFIKFLKMFSIFCPHIAEELWEKIGGKGFVSVAEWPKADENKINEKFEQEEKAVEKIVSDILNVLNIIKEKQGKEGQKIYLYVLPNEFENYNAEAIGRRVGKEVIVFVVNDKSKHDPEGKAGKAKPGKPGIYVE